MTPENPIFVGTFHKSGTILLGDIFERAASRLGLVFLKPAKGFWDKGAAPRPDFDILFDGASRFLRSPRVFSRDARALVSIRDPRDLIVSAALYHMNSKERWVVMPSEHFSGKSYQQMLRALPDDAARFIFEMDHAAARTITKMLEVDRNDTRVFVTGLDRLMTDRELDEYRRIFAFLGFGGEALATCLDIAAECSVFSGRVESGHVRHAAPGFWRERFTPALADAFERRFPGAAERLGYAPTFA
jgi:hypothetical protein